MIEPIVLVPHCGPGVGLGHHERMLALAEALQARGVAPLLSVPASHHPSIERAGARGVAVATGDDDPCARALATVTDLRPSACILDGYVYPAELQRELRRVCRVVVVDDLGAAADCDLAVNPSVVRIPAPQGAERFAGAPDHALLSAADQLARRQREERQPQPGRVLVSVGATDTAGLALRISGEIASAGAAEVVVVAGPETLLGDVPRGVEVVHQPASLSELLRCSTVYAGAAGVTAVQAACIGVPMVIVATVANQRDQACALAEASCAVTVTNGEEVASSVLALLSDAPRRHAMSRAGRELVDGRGAGRVAEAVIALAGGRPAGAQRPRP